MTNLLNHRYAPLKSLGDSRSGQTILVEDTRSPTRQRCVVKQLNLTPYSPKEVEQIQAKLSPEAAALEAVSKDHAQIPDLYGYFVTQGIVYWVREWIEGPPLSDLVSAPWPESQAANFLTAALKALVHLHRQRIIHLSLKPKNIIIRSTDQAPCLVGIGAKALLKAVGDQALMMRTSGFIAPEQAVGKPVLASDIYSLGMTTIYVLSAVPPLKIPSDRSNGRLLWQQYAPDVSDRLAGILTRSIHPTPTIRFPNASEMLAVLSQITPTQLDPNPRPLAFPPVSAPPPTVSPKPVAVSPPQSPSVPATPIPPASPDLPGTEVSLPDSRVAATSPSSAGIAAAAQPKAPATPQPVARKKKLLKMPWLKWAGLGVGAIALGIVGLGALQSLSGSGSSIDASSVAVLEDTIDQLKEKVENSSGNGRANEKATLALVDAYTYAGDIEPAAELINELLEENEQNSEALYQRGKIQVYLSDYDAAIETLEDAIDHDSENGDALVMLGLAHREIGDYDQALEQFQSALDAGKNKGEAHLNISHIQQMQGEWEDALTSVDAAARFLKGDRSIPVHTQRSNIYSDLQNLEKAEEAWEKAAARSPQNPEAYVTQSISKMLLGNSEGALENIEQALDINPNFTEAYAMQGLIQMNQNELEAAIASVTKAIELDPNSVTALKIFADVAALVDPDPTLTLQVATQALSINPNNPYVLNQRCNVLLYQSELALAVEDCTRSLNVNPAGIEAYSSRGQAYLAAAEFQLAEEDFTRIIELNDAAGRPQDPTVYGARAIARTGLEDEQGAEEDIAKALEISVGQ
ncbi:MAG: tetratricopeptide repeat protein [Cyanobacteria bacterium J06560_2]